MLTFRTRPLAVIAFFCGAVVPIVAASGDERPLRDYVGSFRLETGELVHGGPFVERATGDESPVRFLFMDTEGLERTALFERESELLLRSVQPPGTITVELVPGRDGTISGIVWKGPEGPVEGRRVNAHEESDFDFRSQDGVELQGRLLVPDCPDPRPLVVLVSGSGPTTRWAGTFETFFLNLGMAVLVYDKRGVGAQDWYEPDLATLAADASAAVRAGAGYPRVDADRIGIWASSQGGWVAPIAASLLEPEELAFLVVRVGPGVSEMETHLHEIRQEARAEGLSGIGLDHASALRRELYGMAVNGESLAATDAIVEPFLDEPWYRVAFGEGPVSASWSERWWRWAGTNFPVAPSPYLRDLSLPILWFLAEEDENVPMVPSVVALNDAFDASPGRDETLVVIEDSVHSMLVRGPSGGFRYVDGVWSRMRAWLAARNLSDEGCHRPPGHVRSGSMIPSDPQ